MSTFYKLMSFYWVGIYGIVLTICPTYKPDIIIRFNFHISLFIPKLSSCLFPFLLQKVYINVYNNHFVGYIDAYRS